MTDPTPTPTTPEQPFDFETYDRCLQEGRDEYLTGGGSNPYPRETAEWEWWQEGYDQ